MSLPTIKKYLSLPLLISIGLHAAFVVLALQMQGPREPVPVKAQYITVVRVAPVTNLQTPAASGSSRPVTGVRNSSRKIKYHDLLNLPQSDAGLAFPGVTHDKHAYTGDKLGELLVEASELSADFDLPLVFRRNVSKGRAWAIMVLKNGAIEIDFLGGSREIRAAMFESLRTPASYLALENAFKFFKSRRLKISVQYDTYFVPQGQSEFKTERKVFDNELEITMKRYAQAPKYGVTGMVIDDEHSRRAKKRDRRHWSRLLNSPAYKRIIRGYKLTAPAAK